MVAPETFCGTCFWAFFTSPFKIKFHTLLGRRLEPEDAKELDPIKVRVRMLAAPVNPSDINMVRKIFICTAHISFHLHNTKQQDRGQLPRVAPFASSRRKRRVQQFSNSNLVCFWSRSVLDTVSELWKELDPLLKNTAWTVSNKGTGFGLWLQVNCLGEIIANFATNRVLHRAGNLGNPLGLPTRPIDEGTTTPSSRPGRHRFFLRYFSVFIDS